MHILTINAGSSSIKYKVFSHTDQENTFLLGGLIEGIGENGGKWHHQYEQKITEAQSFKNHQEAFDALDLKLKQDLLDCPIDAVGHRVVHGGNQFYQPTIITESILKKIEHLNHLAPLHNPINVLGIKYARQHFKEATHVAIFDSGFHHTMPSFVSTYAIDKNMAKRYEIQRYGFHGINHEYVALLASEFLQKPLPTCNFITLHLGNGASTCLIKEGKSFDTSMGMTPLAGLIMGTRCGDIDPAIPLYLMKEGMTGEEIDTLLNKQSGLKGLTNDNDMRNILARVELGDPDALLAIDMYVYTIQKIIGAYLTQIDSLDALIFTGGVGENSAIIRDRVLAPLSHLGFIIDTTLNQKGNGHFKKISTSGRTVLVIPSDEEELIAQKVVIEKRRCP